MLRMIRRMFGRKLVHQHGNVVGGDMAGGDIYVDGRRQGEGTRAEGPEKQQIRTITAFDRLSIEGPFDVYFQVSEETSVEIRAAENILRMVEATVSRGKLSIALNGNVNIKREIGVRITGPGFSELVMVGAGSFRSGRIVAKSLSVKTVGAGNAALFGKVDKLRLAHEGAGLIDATGMVALHVDAFLTGAGQIEIEAVDTVVGSITGSGDILVNGDSPRIQRRIVGAGRIQHVADKR